MNRLNVHSSKKFRAFIFLLSAAILSTTNFSGRRLLAQEPQDQNTTQDPTTQDTSSASPLAAPTLTWSPKGDNFDTGEESFVAMNASGFLVEVHASPNGTGLYYHLGQLNMQNGAVQWGPSRRFASTGAWPAVAIDSHGLVVITRSDAAFNCCSYLNYWVGSVDINGGVQQRIYFRSSQIEYDRGFHNGLSMNDRDILVDTHESGNGGSGIYYRLGVVTTDYQIEWLSGKSGQRYDDGVDTRVALNLKGDVVEVHRVSGETLLHYTRGTINTNQGKIYFNDKPRYENRGSKPSVAMRDNGYLIGTENYQQRPYYRTGTLSTTQPGRVDWTDRAEMLQRSFDTGTNTSVAVNAIWAITTFEYDGNLYYTTAKLP